MPLTHGPEETQPYAGGTRTTDGGNTAQGNPPTKNGGGDHITPKMKMMRRRAEDCDEETREAFGRLAGAPRVSYGPLVERASARSTTTRARTPRGGFPTARASDRALSLRATANCWQHATADAHPSACPLLPPCTISLQPPPPHRCSAYSHHNIIVAASIAIIHTPISSPIHPIISSTMVPNRCLLYLSILDPLPLAVSSTLQGAHAPLSTAVPRRCSDACFTPSSWYPPLRPIKIATATPAAAQMMS